MLVNVPEGKNVPLPGNSLEKRSGQRKNAISFNFAAWGKRKKTGIKARDGSDQSFAVNQLLVEEDILKFNLDICVYAFTETQLVRALSKIVL